MHLPAHAIDTSRRAHAAASFAFAFALAACGGAPQTTQWQVDPLLEPQTSGTDALFIALSAVDTATVWAAGTGGRWALTTDGGATWTGGVVDGADSLQFRDVHALDARTAWVLSIGNGPQSRIYRTDDGGATWRLQFRSDEPRDFFDCFAFWDAEHALAVGDSWGGTLHVLETTDGESWNRLPPGRLPPADSGEGAFASSGTCLVAAGDSTAWIGTGASDGAARVFRTTDRGRTWTVVQTPLTRGGSAGITTLAFRDEQNGVALGGDVADHAALTDNAAVTHDGGETWELVARPPFTGPAHGVSWVPGAPTPTIVAVGPRGVGYSLDEGRTWTPLDTANHWAVAFAAPDRGWAAGPGGRITRIRIFSRQ